MHKAALRILRTFTQGAFLSANGSANPKWHQVTIMADYSLGKRTDVYAEGVYQHASRAYGPARSRLNRFDVLLAGRIYEAAEFLHQFYMRPHTMVVPSQPQKRINHTS